MIRHHIHKYNLYYTRALLSINCKIVIKRKWRQLHQYIIILSRDDRLVRIVFLAAPVDCRKYGYNGMKVIRDPRIFPEIPYCRDGTKLQ